MTETFSKANLLKLTEIGYYVEVRNNRGYTEVGIREPKKNIFHWYVEFSVTDDYLFYDHSYCMNTGKVSSGKKYGWKVKERINKVILRTIIHPIA